MKSLIILATALTMFVGSKGQKFWENYSEIEKQKVLKFAQVDSSAVHLYHGLMPVTDDKEPCDFLYRLIEYGFDRKKNDPLNAFYFHCFADMVLRADGSLAESMGDYCIRICLNNPVYSINYLEFHPDVMEKFIVYIGYELYFEEDREEKLSELNNILSKTGSTIVTSFINKIREEYETELNHTHQISSTKLKYIQSYIKEHTNIGNETPVPQITISKILGDQRYSIAIFEVGSSVLLLNPVQFERSKLAIPNSDRRYFSEILANNNSKIVSDCELDEIYKEGTWLILDKSHNRLYYYEYDF